ncbi:MAG: ubiquitin-like protein UBact [Chthoniobacteraceae bacterium]
MALPFSWLHGEGKLCGEFSTRTNDMPERTQQPLAPAPWGPKQGDGGGPHSPDVSRPDTRDLLKRMRRVDPDQSKRYRQRTGQ